MFSFGAPTQTSTFSGFNFGCTSATTGTSTLTGTTNTFASPFTGLGSGTTTTNTGLLMNKAITTTTASLFAPTLSNAPAFPSLGQVTSTNSGFSFGSSTVPSLTGTVSAGLGGVDVQSSTGLNGRNSSIKKEGKTVKETQIPNEIAVTIESFKKYVKEQKAIREEMSRISSKYIFKVQEQVAAFRQQLSLVSNGLQRNAIAIAKLKEISNQELKNAEIAQRTKDSPSSLQYENNAPTEYFHNLANSFEHQMQLYRQQIEQLERHLLSLSKPYTLTPNEWTAVTKRLHDTFVTLAAQLQSVHQEIQTFKEHFIANQKLDQSEVRNLFASHKDNTKDRFWNYMPDSVTYGPSPFATMQSAVGKAITVFNRTQQLPVLGSNALGKLSSSVFENDLSANNASFNLNRSSLLQSSFKPLVQPGVPSFPSSNLGDTSGFVNDPQSPFGLNSQKPFQLQKPPSGNKRGKRWTST